MSTSQSGSPCSATAQISTASAQRAMTRLCKHFAHKAPVELAEASGRIEFTAGHVELSATVEALDLRLHARDAATLEALQGVVERHLKMVEFREAMPVVHWTRSD